MNASFLASPFSAVDMAPRDPILSISEDFNENKNPAKVNLGVGVYYGESGKIPLLECVQKAEALLIKNLAPRSYLPIEGSALYNNAVQELLFGAESPVLRQRRVATVQAIGGTGALKLGADLLRFIAAKGTQVWISDPSWENHRSLFEKAGFIVNNYPYYDPETRGVNFDSLLKALDNMPKGSVVVLHACCHNPTGSDLSSDEWIQVINVVNRRGLIPFLDMAYQGFDEGIERDGKAIHLFVEAGGTLLIANSFSKSFSLYGERVGALSIVSTSKKESNCTLSQLKRIIRTNYSNPPIHGSQVVATILTETELRELWEEELSLMRVRISEMRRVLIETLKKHGVEKNFDFITKQRGMFSYSGLTRHQVQSLRDKFSVYAVETGRICIAALNMRNVDYVATAIAEVLQS
jgi:aromatic-amino-acid transaminase